MTDVESKEGLRSIPSSQLSLAENLPAESVEQNTADAVHGEPGMEVHPYVIATALAGWAWAVAALFIMFLVLGSKTAQVLVMTIFISLAVLGLLVGCGWHARGVADRASAHVRQPASFREFLDGEVEIATGRVKGSELYGMALAMAVALAIMGTGLAIAIGVLA